MTKKKKTTTEQPNGARPDWPDVEMPEPMAVEELEAILVQLGASHGHPEERFPLTRLAPALGLTSPRNIYRWLEGAVGVDPARAKLLRIFAVHGRVF